ncbi:hypothetical protein IMZ48_00460 [Candidatus Bathyarchaeota archaeon]|nr:hypothetical protein [Candidatus Bathyarchaeota archaeon]
MFSGWKETVVCEETGEITCTSLAERLRNDNKNNMRVEPQLTNKMQNDYSNKLRPFLRQLVLEINVPKKWADPSLKMGPYNAAIEKKIEQAGSKAKQEAWKVKDAQRAKKAALEKGSKAERMEEERERRERERDREREIGGEKAIWELEE